ncbi:DUF2391 family protein [Candidatus Woesearchaeota archaeon]|nr:DUF2391 family protein [Candidatus Woesearchaeota archaeon]
MRESKKLDIVEHDVEEIKKDIEFLNERLIDKRLQRFSRKDITNALFGALTVGLTFVFKGLLIEVGMRLPWSNVIMIVTMTLFILTTEIYFVGYRHVKNVKERPFGEFLIKRLIAMYLIAVVVSFFLLYLFGFIYLAGTLENFVKLIFVVAMPCAIGAAIPNLLKPE